MRQESFAIARGPVPRLGSLRSQRRGTGPATDLLQGKITTPKHDICALR